MKNRLFVIIFLAFVLVAESVTAFGQQYKSYFYFARRELAERKVIPSAELKACLLGETYLPPNYRDFKMTIDAGTQTQAGLLKRKLCDVALIFNISAEEEKSMKEEFPGFAIYKIAGKNLELFIYPEDIAYVAVGKMSLVNETQLLKKDITACGTSQLRRLFGPSPNIWREGWSDWNAPIPDLKKENNPIDNGNCDVWVMHPDSYKIFVKRVGGKHPTFDVSLDRDELTRRK